MSPVIVYRDRILPRSELNFMHRQYLGFQRLRPVWVGRRVEPDLDRSQFPLGPIFDGWRATVFKEFGIVTRLAELRDLKAVCVHAQFGRGGALALPLAEKLALPLCVTFHGGEFKTAHYRRFPPALFRRRLERLKQYASLFICVSPGVHERLIAKGFPPERTLVLPIGVEVGALAPRSMPGKGIYFVGRFVEMKGASLLVAAVRRLRREGCDEPLVLIGDGPTRASVANAAQDIENVEFRGWQAQDQVRGALRGARMICIPSIRAKSGELEGLPSVAVEAMELGVPVIASSDAGAEGLIEDGVSGHIFPSGDVPALTGAIRVLLADDERCRSIVAAARRKVTQDFDASKQSLRLESLLWQAKSDALGSVHAHAQP